jgi:hypothetical protein
LPRTVQWDYGLYNGKLSNTYTLTPAPVRPNLTPSTFFVGERASTALRDKLWGNFRFSSNWAIRERPKNVSETLGFGPDVSNSAYFTDLDDVCYGRTHPNDLVNLFLEREPRDILDGLAKSMTTYIRSFDDGGLTAKYNRHFNITDEDPVKGTSYELQAYIAIRWEWLAFSASLYVTSMYELHVRHILTSYTNLRVTLTLLFFVLVVWQLTLNGVPVWKSSPLALLFHGLRGFSEDQGRSEMEIGEMEKRAREIKVKLQDAQLVVVEDGGKAMKEAVALR